MKYDLATKDDINQLVDLRILYLQEDFGEIKNEKLNLIRSSLPDYFEKHLNQDLIVYVIREKEMIIACAFLLITDKPMSPAFINGRTGTVLNVYTRPSYRKNGYGKLLMKNLLWDAKNKKISVVELKATEQGYSLYKSVGFEDVVTKYRNMKIIFSEDM